MATTPYLKKAAGDEFATTLASGLAQGATSATLTSVSGLNTSGGKLIIDEGTSKEEVIYYESIAGSVITIATNGRGQSGTTDVAHDAGATVTDILTKDMINDFMDRYLVEHDDDGGHKQIDGAITVSGTAISSSNKAYDVASLSTIVNTIYPVGSIYISTVSTNPNTLFGVGTWTAFGAGRTLVGIDAGQTEFDTVEETGGEKTHTLTTTEMPSHTHNFYRYNGNFSAGTITYADDKYASINYSGGSQVSQSGGIVSAGSGSAHNNLQPYIVTYMWKRTA